MRTTVQILVVLMLAGLSGCGCACCAGGGAVESSSPRTADAADSDWNPPPELEFLRTVPELRGVSLRMSEQDFQNLAKSRNLNIRTDQLGDQTSYWVSTASGENVIVMFRDHACRGIQRMQPTPRGKAS